MVSKYKMLFTVARPQEIKMRTSSLYENCWMLVGPRDRERRRTWGREEKREICETWEAEWQCELGACAKPYMQTQCAKQQQEQEWITDVPTNPNPAEIFFPSSLFLPSLGDEGCLSDFPDHSDFPPPPPRQRSPLSEAPTAPFRQELLPNGWLCAVCQEP